MKKFIIAAIGLMILNTSCIQMLDEAAKAASNNNENRNESITIDTSNEVVVDSLYQLGLPYYMKEMKSLHPDASLEYANIYKEAYTVVIHEEKQYFIDLFTEYDEYDTTITAIENYANVQTKMFKEQIDNLKLQHYGLIEVNGYPARQICRWYRYILYCFIYRRNKQYLHGNELDHKK